MNDPIETVLALSRARRRLPGVSHRRRIREAAGLSQADIARGVGVTRAAISRWERGERTPTGEALLAYETLLAQLATDQYKAELGGSR